MNFIDPSGTAVILASARLCLALFFFASSIGKIANHRDFLERLVDYRIVPAVLVRPIGFGLPVVELITALGLLSGIRPLTAGVGAATLLTCFSIAVLVNLLRGREIGCGCYAIASSDVIGPGTIVRNLILIGLAGFVAVHDPMFGLGQDSVAVLRAISDLPLNDLAVTAFLLVFSFVLASLTEWAVNIYVRVSRLDP